MRKGEKILCTKTVIEQYHKCFNKDTVYIIGDISCGCKGVRFYILIDEFGKSFAFNVDENDRTSVSSGRGDFNFYDFFITLKEIRKLKLEEIGRV